MVTGRLESKSHDPKCVLHARINLILLLKVIASRIEEQERRLWFDARPRRSGNIVGREPLVLVFARAPEIAMADRSRAGTSCIAGPDHEADSYALLDVEHILIYRSIWRPLPFLAITMQVENVNMIKCLHKTVAHTAERRIVQVSVVGD